MNSVTMRIGIAVVVVAVAAVGNYYMRVASGAKKDITPPEHKLETLPLELGEWRGEEKPMSDERQKEAIGAQETLNRVYVDSKQNYVTVHAASEIRFVRRLPHSPMLCYPGNGYTVIESKRVTLPGVEGEAPSAQLVSFEREGRRIFVLYWYQLGDQICLDADDLASARRKLRSECETWPAILKFLLETPVNPAGGDESRLLDFAGLLYQKTKDLQGRSYLKADAASETPGASTSSAGQN